MVRWLADRLQALRTWSAVRLGVWRGQWRHGGVQVSPAPFAFNPFVPRAWRYSLYSPGGLADDSAAPLVIVLHGCRQRASSFAVAAGLTRLASLCHGPVVDAHLDHADGQGALLLQREVAAEQQPADGNRPADLAPVAGQILRRMQRAALPVEDVVQPRPLEDANKLATLDRPAR